MCRLITLGWFTGRQWSRGRDGIRTRGSGLAGRISRLGSASTWAGSAGLAVDGRIGALTGTTITRSITMCAITRTATRSITATPIITGITITVETTSTAAAKRTE